MKNQCYKCDKAFNRKTMKISENFGAMNVVNNMKLKMNEHAWKIPEIPLQVMKLDFENKTVNEGAWKWTEIWLHGMWKDF